MAVSSLVASGGVQAAIGKGRRTGEAPHEVFNTTLIVSSGLLGDGGTGMGVGSLVVDTDFRGEVSDRGMMG